MYKLQESTRLRCRLSCFFVQFPSIFVSSMVLFASLYTQCRCFSYALKILTKATIGRSSWPSVLSFVVQVRGSSKLIAYGQRRWISTSEREKCTGESLEDTRANGSVFKIRGRFVLEDHIVTKHDVFVCASTSVVAVELRDNAHCACHRASPT